MALLAFDNFNRANGGLGSNWTTATSLAAPQIVSNQVRTNAVGTDSAAFYNAVTWPGNQWSQMTYATENLSTAGAEVLVRVATGVKTFYSAHIAGPFGATAKYSIRRYIAGALTTLVTTTTFTLSANDVIRFEASGPNLTLYQNNIKLSYASDASITTGSAGLYVYVDTGVVGDSLIDDWSGGDFSAPPQIARFYYELP